MSSANRIEERDARDEAAELARRPNLSAVVDRMLVVIETLPAGRRRQSLEACVGSLDIGMGPSDDLTDEEAADWLKNLADAG